MTTPTDQFVDIANRSQEAVATAVHNWADTVQSFASKLAAGQSQLAGEAGGSRDVGTHATVGAAPTTYGTGRHCQTARVRQAVMRRRTRGTAV